MRARRILAFTAAAFALAGCSGLSLDWFGSSPPKQVNVMLDFDSDPQGAEAKTSIGPSCQTPCRLEVPTSNAFTVTFTHEGYGGQTIPVQVQQQTGAAAVSLTPNPVFAQLTAVGPAKKRKPAAKPAAKPADAAPGSGSR